MGYRSYIDRAKGGTARTQMDWPISLLDAVKARAEAEDENVSALVRKVLAQYVGWEGPTRNIRSDRNDA